jgi:hypothetical protein
LANAQVEFAATSVNETAFHVDPSTLHSKVTAFVKVLVALAPQRTVMFEYPIVEIPGLQIKADVPVVPLVAVAFIDAEAPA